MNRRSFHRLAFGAVAAASVAAFVIDISVDTGILSAIPYVLLVMLAGGTGVQGAVSACAVVVTIFTCVGLVVSPVGFEEPWKVVADRLMAVGAIWATASVRMRVERRRVEYERRAAEFDKAELENERRSEESVRRARVLSSMLEDLRIQQERLEKSDQRFRDAIEHAPTATVMIGADGSVELVNRRLEELFGYSRDDVVGQPFEMLFADRSRDEHPEYTSPQSLDGKGGRSGARPALDLVGRRQDGKEIDVQVRLSPLDSEQGHCLLGGIEDVSNRKAQAEELHRYAELLERTNRELAESNEDLDSFAYIASHDLQEPMRNLISFAQLLERDLGSDLNPDAREDLHFIMQAAQRMRSLVQSLLTFSRAGRKELERQSLSLDECVDDALSSLKTLVEESGAEVEWLDLPDVRGDRTLITQLFQNLLGNAIKFRSEEAPKVQITAAADDSEWMIEVRDNGIGIKPEYTEQIFAPFKRLHSMAEYDGTGIGLAICRKAVDRHGGRIWVESGLGEGACFRFTLPREAADSGEDAEAETLEGETS